MPRLVPDEEESADHSIAEAARCSYQRGTKTIADDKTLIRYLMRHEHTSPLEMVEFKFHIKLPMYICTQLIRHRTASLNIMSGRYSEMPDEFYVPEITDYRYQSKINHQGSDGYMNEEDSLAMKEAMEKGHKDTFELYQYMLEKGLVKELARGILPYNLYTQLYWKIDLKNLLHFLDVRCDKHAQKEIKVVADAILKLIKCIVPWTIDAWEDYSPYRGGMILTRHEVEALKRTIMNLERNGPFGHTPEPPCSIDVDNKLEQKEWKDKAQRLGFKSV
jgi:thymidylate synthase (FAD)